MLARHSSHDRRAPGHAKIDVVPARPSRRLLITGALALTTGALTGCGVRLEDDAPDLPFVPRREPIPGEAALLAVLGTLEDSDAVHSAQRAGLLRDALEEAQVPVALLDEAAAPATDAETAAAFEASVRECGPHLLRLIGQLTASHRITTPLGDKVRLWTAAGTDAWQAGEVAATALEATRATMYALDVLAGQTARPGQGKVPEAALTASRELQGLSVRQTTAAGDAVEPIALGYDRPDDLSGTKGHDWVVGSFVRLQAAYADCFDHLADDRDAALEVTQWMVTAEEISRAQFLQDVPELYGDGEHQP